MTDTTKPEDLSKEFEGLFNEIEGGHVNDLKNLKGLQMITQSLFQHEERRLKRKLGESHPRVRQIKEREKFNLNLINDLDVELEIANIKVSGARETDILIHGRVITGNHRGIKGLSVHLSDEKGKLLTLLGRSVTNHSGYYSLVIDADTSKKASGLLEKGVYLTVVTKEDKIVYRSPDPLKPVEGEKKFEEIVVPEDLRRPWGKPVKPHKKEEKKKKEEKDTDGETESVKLEDINGIGTARANNLRKAGIKDIEAFVKTDEGKLKRILGNVNVRKMKREAASLLKKKKDKS